MGITKLIKSIFYHLYLYRLFNVKLHGLNLGSGGTRVKDFCNIDADIALDTDIVADINNLKLNSNSVNLIYNSHVFEHVPRHKSYKVLKRWHRVLKPGGKLYLSIPDLETLFRLYLDYLNNYDTDESKFNLGLIKGIIYGGQTDKYDFHYNGYCFNTLKETLEAIGFKDIKRISEPPAGISVEDAAFSARVGETLISLNIEATK